ncbi:DUF1554 domain-containing protein [Leptospira stimsonii]|uniref:DUF1554 domain-containing protein n=1 Tax=Leptospira stimsonii TaxID=2202203 RepID=A0ABY2NEI8_9LEPT|nr:DUF1554 domain-containing protein [Leptospira stimsonii]TGK26017.1 DUF1554 domain-containing protein [Leptospira stimsonii]TGM22450.1 DUF1554 domain-containing protein [Leptospira stimsonii]
MRNETTNFPVSISILLVFFVSCNEAERLSTDALKNPLIALIEPARFFNSSSNLPSTNVSTCATDKGPCYIFELYNIAGVLTNGNIGGVAGADTLCQNAAAVLPSAFGSPSEYKAMIMDESGERNLTKNWVLYPNTNYLNIKKSTLNPNDSVLAFKTDSQAIYTGTLTNRIIVDGTRPPNTYTFTGIRIDTPGSPGTWLPGDVRSCFDWTSTAIGTTYGSIGYPEEFSTYFIDRGYFSASGCDTQHGIYCVRQ